jgi:nucleotide-binding universal stress UspA family protein
LAGGKATKREGAPEPFPELHRSRGLAAAPGPWALSDRGREIDHRRVREFPSPLSERDPDTTGARHHEADPDTAESAVAEPLRLPPLLSRRHSPWLLVEVDGTSARLGALVWALREAARREATVLAVTVLDDDHPLGAPRPPSPADQAAARQLLEAQVLRAITETGGHGRVRTAVLDRAVFEALDAAAMGADLVIVGASSKTLLRPALGRPPLRRPVHGA